MKLLARVPKALLVIAACLTLILSGAFTELPGKKTNLIDTNAHASHSYQLIWYYSDAEHTNHVGTRTIYCDGRGTLTGTVTGFSEVLLSEPCCGSVEC